MGECWRALSERHEVRIYIEPSGFEHGFDGSELAGLDWRRVEAGGMDGAVRDVAAFRPDLALICGWSTPLVKLMTKSDIGCRKVLAFDMPWEWSFRKFAARWALRPRLRHFSAAFVPGMRALKYAEWLGFRGRVIVGSNPSGWERFRDVVPGKRGFVFVGRLSPEKGLDTLARAYSKYRCIMEDPWPLDIVGEGNARFGSVEGMNRLGFMHPDRIPGVMAEHAALILPSNHETWGISALEAMSAGLMTIATRACGFTSDVEPTFSCEAGDADGLCKAMIKAQEMGMTERDDETRRAREFAECYSAWNWACRLERFIH